MPTIVWDEPIERADGARVWAEEWAAQKNVPGAAVTVVWDDDVVKAPAHGALATLAARLAPSMRRAFETAIDQMASSADLEILAARLLGNDVSQATALTSLDEILAGSRLQAAWARTLREAFIAGMEAGALATRPVGVSFGLVRRQSVAWAEQRAAALVVQVAEDTRQAIRGLVTNAFVQGVDVRTLARQIRPLIGLTEAQALAVTRAHQRRLDDGRTPAQAQADADRYAKKLLRYRANTIARNETLVASGEGRAQQWQAAVDRGLLDPTITRKKWIVADDERLCPICAPLADVEVPLLDEFPGGYDHPPEPHVQCRCAVALVFEPHKAATKGYPEFDPDQPRDASGRWGGGGGSFEGAMGAATTEMQRLLHDGVTGNIIGGPRAAHEGVTVFDGVRGAMAWIVEQIEEHTDAAVSAIPGLLEMYMGPHIPFYPGEAPHTIGALSGERIFNAWLMRPDKVAGMTPTATPLTAPEMWRRVAPAAAGKAAAPTERAVWVPLLFLVPRARAKGYPEFDPDQPRDASGRWGGGVNVDEPAMRDLVGRLDAPDGGFSIHPVTHASPTTGYMVSPYPERSKVLQVSEITAPVLARYIMDNRDALTKPSHYFGAWHDPADHRVWLDISIHTADEAEARALARTHKQIAYFDLARGASVTVEQEEPTHAQAKSRVARWIATGPLSRGDRRNGHAPHRPPADAGGDRGDAAHSRRGAAEVVDKHYGPGAHPSGSPQSVHGGGGGGAAPLDASYHGIPEPQARQLASFETEMRAHDHEALLVVQPDGKVLLHKTGRESFVEIAPEEMIALAMAGKHDAAPIASHNHPRGTAFSLDDALMSSRVSAREARVVGKDYTYRLRPKAAWPTIADMRAAYKAADTATFDLFSAEIKLGERTTENASAEHHHTVWSIIAPQLGLSYERIPHA